MKQILGIIGSPRKLGNCEVLVKEISRNIEEDHVLKLIRMPDLKIQPCRACYKCVFGERCPLDDDFKCVMDSLIESDAVIFASPTYVLGPNASIKAFSDRGMQFYNVLDKMSGKPGVTVTVAGVNGGEGYTSVALAVMARFMGLNVKEDAVFFGALPGEVLVSKKNLDKAAHLGRILFDKGYARKQESYLCPVCSSDTFQLLSGNRVKCKVCNNKGSISSKNGILNIDILPGKGSFYMSYEKSMAHKEWLVGMKNRFLENKERLKEITSRYKKDGEWIKGDHEKS